MQTNDFCTHKKNQNKAKPKKKQQPQNKQKTRKKNVFNVASSYIKMEHFHIFKRYALYNL
jgi:hypothetical protein